LNLTDYDDGEGAQHSNAHRNKNLFSFLGQHANFPLLQDDFNFKKEFGKLSHLDTANTAFKGSEVGVDDCCGLVVGDEFVEVGIVE
jgi:hypothetical protein